MIKTILVPTDGSEHAGKAVELASDLARQYDARLVLLHVLLRDAHADDLRQLPGVEITDEMQEELVRYENEIQTAVATGGMGAVAVPVMPPREILEQVGRQILDAAEAVAAEAGVKNVSVHVEDGDPAKKVLAAAAAEHADMIVMGSRGLSDFRGLLMGSVSHKVSHLAECTCVTVK